MQAAVRRLKPLRTGRRAEVSEQGVFLTGNSKRLLTVPEAVGEYGFACARELYRLIREGVIPLGPVVRLGREVRVNREAFERWLAAGGSALPGRGDPEPEPGPMGGVGAPGEGQP